MHGLSDPWSRLRQRAELTMFAFLIIPIMVFIFAREKTVRVGTTDSARLCAVDFLMFC